MPQHSGVSDRWRDTDRREFCKAVAGIVDRTLKSVVDVRRLSAIRVRSIFPIPTPKKR